MKAYGKFERLLFKKSFYAFLAATCGLDAAVGLLDYAIPGESPPLDIASAILSLIAAFLTFMLFLSLHSRRPERSDDRSRGR